MNKCNEMSGQTASHFGNFHVHPIRQYVVPAMCRESFVESGFCIELFLERTQANACQRSTLNDKPTWDDRTQ